MVVAVKRRWFRFRLRTMLVAFTVVAVWLGWNVWLVSARKAFVENLPDRTVALARREVPSMRPHVHEALSRQYFDSAIDAAFRWPSKDPYDPRSRRLPYATHRPSTAGELSWLRRMLGDKPYLIIACFPGAAAERALKLFPEATIVIANEPWPEWTESGMQD
jgi:hypothetical protein